MKTLTLQRIAYLPHATLGQIIHKKPVMVSVEQAWRGNEPFRSCVPEGTYSLIPYASDAYPDTWALSGESVSVYEDPIFKRYTCLLHLGNWGHDVVGCISPGMAIEVMDGELAVSSSREAMSNLRALIQTHEISILEIVGP